MPPKQPGIRLLMYHAIFLLTGANCLAQKVTLQAVDEPIPAVLRKIQAQTGFSIVFGTETFEHAPPVTLKLANASLEKALNECFDGLEFSYKKYDSSYSVFSTGSNTASVFSPLRGRITNPDGEPLAGVSVMIHGTDKGGMTDGNGRFSIPASGHRSSVKISCTGYSSRIEYLDNRDVSIIVLQPYSIPIEEVVIRAYGTTTTRLNTGSSSQVKASVLERQPVMNMLAALPGRVPGLYIQQLNGIPGGSFKVLLRGQSSIDNGKQPLLIVDGIIFSGGVISGIPSGSAKGPVESNMLNSIDPGNIASIEVLKDAAATAIYGSRGANGVIIITLKKGTQGKPQLTISSYGGITRAVGTGNLMTTGQYLSMRRTAVTNDGLTPDANSIPEYAFDTSKSRNVKKEIFGGTGIVNDHSVSLSGGNANHLWFINGNYHRESSVVPGNQFDRRISTYGNYSYESGNKKLQLQLSGNYSHELNPVPVIDPTSYILMSPFTPRSTDSWSVANIPYINFKAVQSNTYQAGIDNWFMHGAASYQLLPGLILKSSYGYNSGVLEEESWQPRSAQDPALKPTGYHDWSRIRVTSKVTEVTADYSFRIGKKGKVDVLAGATRQEERKESMSLIIEGYDNPQSSAGSDHSQTQVSFDKTTYRYEALLARLEYNLSDRYIITASGRKDASSRFGPGRQYGTFGAIGAAWIFTSEKFVDWPHWLSFGKLRASYGTTGNDQIGDYKFAALYNTTSAATGYQGSQGLVPGSFYNPNLSWEINYKGEAGLDLGLMRNKVILSAAAYRNWTDNELIVTSTAAQSGLPGEPTNQRVVILNRGVECSIRTINYSDSFFHWSSTLSLTIPENRLQSFPGLKNSTYAGAYMVGKSLSEQIGFGYQRVDQQTGLYTFLDKDRNNILDQRDYIAGGNLDPRWYGGLDNILSYKDWELGLFLEFRRQNGIDPFVEMLRQNLPGMAGNYSQGNFPVQFLHYWQHPGDQAPFQRVSAGASADVAERAADLISSNARVRDASFIRLKNLSLSHKLSQRMLHKFHMKDGSVYLRGQNIFTVTNFPFTDPETQNFSSLPPVKTVVLGLQFTI